VQASPEDEITLFLVVAREGSFSVKIGEKKFEVMGASTIREARESIAKEMWVCRGWEEEGGEGEEGEKRERHEEMRERRDQGEAGEEEIGEERRDEGDERGERRKRVEKGEEEFLLTPSSDQPSPSHPPHPTWQAHLGLPQPLPPLPLPLVP
jgi:hypothetical protein